MIHYFNPGHETAVLNGSPYYTTPTNLTRMRQEFSFLPAWYASSDDFVFVNNDFDLTYSESLVDLYGPMCSPVSERDLKNIQYEKVCLWGISPQSIHFWEDLQYKFQVEFILPNWNEKYLYLNSRMAARDCLSDLVLNISQIPDTLIPIFYSTLENIEEAVINSDVQLLAKAPYSSSGRGLLWLPLHELTRTERQILHGILKKQQLVSIEKALNKKIDFAMEFIIDNQGQTTFSGYSLFSTNKKGAYQGNILSSQLFIENYLSDKITISLLNSVKYRLEEILTKIYAPIYVGCIGVDMMIFEENGLFILHPCVEINLRYNMGYLSISFFEKFVHPLSVGEFTIDFSSKAGSIIEQHQQMQKRYPLCVENNKLKSGYLSLCPVSQSNHYWAYVLVNDSGVETQHK